MYCAEYKTMISTTVWDQLGSLKNQVYFCISFLLNVLRNPVTATESEDTDSQTY